MNKVFTGSLLFFPLSVTLLHRTGHVGFQIPAVHLMNICIEATTEIKLPENELTKTKKSQKFCDQCFYRCLHFNLRQINDATQKTKQKNKQTEQHSIYFDGQRFPVLAHTGNKSAALCINSSLSGGKSLKIDKALACARWHLLVYTAQWQLRNPDPSWTTQQTGCGSEIRRTCQFFVQLSGSKNMPKLNAEVHDPALRLPWLAQKDACRFKPHPPSLLPFPL